MKIIKRYGSLIVFVLMVLVITYLNALSLKQDEKKTWQIMVQTHKSQNKFVNKIYK